MDAFLRFLTSNQPAMMMFGGIIALVMLIYLVAFIQGREISFWPPRIGSKNVSDEGNKKRKGLLKSRSLVDDFFLEEFPSSFRDDISAAQEVWIVGVTLRGTIRDFGGIIENKLRKGDKFRVLIVDPDSLALDIVTARYYGPISTDVERVRLRIKDSLKSLCGLKQIAPDNIEIRTINNPLTFGGFCINPETESGVLYLEHFPFRTAPDSIPRFVLQASDKHWYEFFKKEVLMLWSAAEVWDCKESLKGQQSGPTPR